MNQEKILKNIVFGGYLIESSGKRIQLPASINPTEHDIDIFFASLNQEVKKGVITLRISPEPDFGAFDLTVQIDDGRYLPLIGEYLEEEDGELGVVVNVKTIQCDKYSGEEVAILGDFIQLNTRQKIKFLLRIY